MWAGRAKWQEETNNLQVGEIIWLIDKETKPGEWKIGRIVEVYPGTDEKVRVVKLRVNGKELIRPVSQVFPLEVRRELEAKE